MENMKRAANAYKTAQIDAAVLGASPHELIRILLSKAIESTEAAKVHMLNGDISAKGQAIDLALAIIADGLRSSLNMEDGGEIAENLDALYEYMARQLLKGHAENSPDILDEVGSLLKNIKEGWEGIKPQQASQTELQPQL